MIADASLKGLLDGGLTSLWRIKIHRNDGSFRRTLDCIERFLAYRIIAKIKWVDLRLGPVMAPWFSPTPAEMRVSVSENFKILRWSVSVFSKIKKWTVRAMLKIQGLCSET